MSAPTAAEVITALKAKGLPVGAFVNYTAENDPNQRLGRPREYIGKVNFWDTRLKRQSDYDTDSGGSN